MVGMRRIVPTSLRNPSTMSPRKCRNPWGNSGGPSSSASSISSLCVTWARSAVPRLGSGSRQHRYATTRPGNSETKKATRQPCPWKSGPRVPPMARPMPSPT